MHEIVIAVLFIMNVISWIAIWRLSEREFESVPVHETQKMIPNLSKIKAFSKQDTSKRKPVVNDDQAGWRKENDI